MALTWTKIEAGEYEASNGDAVALRLGLGWLVWLSPAEATAYKDAGPFATMREARAYCEAHQDKEAEDGE